jgi:hypothetical protein
MAEVDPAIKEAVATNNYKTGAEIPTVIMGTLMNDVVVQHRMANIGFIMASTNSNHNHSRCAEVLDKRIAELDTEEVSANVKDRTGFDAQSQAFQTAQSITQLTAAITNSQTMMGTIVSTLAVLMKGVELTPPYRPTTPAK